MKTHITTANDSFNPVTLAVTFESQAEMDAFAAAFNFAPLNDALKEAGGCSCHEEISKALAGHGAQVYPAFHTINESLTKWARNLPNVARR